MLVDYPRSSDVMLSSFLVLQTENMDRFSIIEEFSTPRLKVLLSRSHQLYRNKTPEVQRLVDACLYKKMTLKLAELEKNDKETVNVVREELAEKNILLKKGLKCDISCPTIEGMLNLKEENRARFQIVLNATYP